MVEGKIAGFPCVSRVGRPTGRDAWRTAQTETREKDKVEGEQQGSGRTIADQCVYAAGMYWSRTVAQKWSRLESEIASFPRNDPRRASFLPYMRTLSLDFCIENFIFIHASFPITVYGYLFFNRIHR